MNKNNLPTWRVDNLFTVLPMIVLIGTFFVYLNRLTIVETKLDILIASQKELTNEFRDWKTQAETRLGTVESRQNTVVSYLNDHLQINIK